MDTSGKRVLLVANPGGHLQQLFMLNNRLPFDGKRLWATADTAQSRSLLADEDVVFLRDVGSRDYVGLGTSLIPGWRLLRSRDFEAVVSTGSGMALAVLPTAAMKGIPSHYIESATRTEGASKTGALLQKLSRVHLYTQHQRWADDRWFYAGSVFDGFERVDHQRAPSIRNVVVSLGTQQVYGFRRLLDRLVDLLPEGTNVLWQTGSTDTTGLAIDHRPEVPASELEAAILDADLVIAHAGTGIALTAFLAGKSPVLVPREAAHDEHVDDHQLQTAELLDTMRLAVVSRLDQLDLDALERAASYRVTHKPDPSPLALAGLSSRPTSQGSR